MSHYKILLYISIATMKLIVAHRSPRIVGGDIAEEGQFPYQALLRSSGRNACGGTIVTERFVVTAAHCVVNRRNKLTVAPIQIVAGATDLNSTSEKRVVVVDVERVFALKEFDPSNIYRRVTADIAVLKLHKDLGIDENPNLGKLDLPDDEDGETFAGVEAVISGFGWNRVEIAMDPLTFLPREVNGEFYGNLRFAKVHVLSNAECAKYYYDPPAEQQICASVAQRDPAKPEGTCTGDSGGPVAYNYTLIGVVSSSPMGCRENHKPAVHTRVSKHAGFVRKVIDGEIDDTMRFSSLPLSNV